MTFLDLKNLVAYWLDDLQFGYFTPPQVGLWLNNGQKEVQKKLVGVGQNYYLKCVETLTVTNQSKYALPQDLKKINALWAVVSGTSPNETNSKISPVTTNEVFLAYFNTGVPSIYTISKSSINLYPFPDNIYTLRMKYTYQVADMALDTDVPDVPESYQELIGLYAARDGFIKDGRKNDLIEAKIALYEKEMVSDANERRQDKARSIVRTGFSNDVGASYYW